MMAPETSAREEDYLKFIWKHSADDELVPLKVISRGMGVVPGTVTAMLKNLDASGYISYRSRRGCILTEKGRDTALSTLRRHRLLERFLVDIMKMKLHEVHEEAEKLEHVISGRFVDQMDMLLDYPLYDPHGDPIPRQNGEVPEIKGIPLSECKTGASFEVIRLLVDDSDILRKLTDISLVPGSQLVRSEAEGIGSLFVRGLNGHEHAINNELAAQIIIQQLKE